MIDENIFLSLFENTTVLLDQITEWPNKDEVSKIYKAINSLINAIRNKDELLKNQDRIKKAWNTIRLFCKQNNIEQTTLLQDIRWTFTQVDSKLFKLGLVP